MSTRATITTCLLTLVVGVGLARAQDAAPTLAVVRSADPAASKAAAYVRFHVRSYLNADERFSHIAVEPTLKSRPARNAAKAFEVAATMVQKGREAYDSLELDQSIDYLNKAIRKYERHAAYLEAPRPISEALIALGAAYILRGEERTGKKILKKAVLADPMAKPDPRIFNPSMMEIFHDAQDEALNSPRGSVNIISNPSYASVHMDGKFIGVTPLSHGEVLAGRHYFRVAMDGYRSYGKALDIHAHAEESISGNLKPLPALNKLENLYAKAIERIEEEKPHPAVRELAAYFKAEQVFLAQVKLDGERVTVTAALFDIEMETRAKLASTSFLFDPERFKESVHGFMDQHFGQNTLYKPNTMASASGGTSSGSSSGDGGSGSTSGDGGGVGSGSGSGELPMGTVLGFPAGEFKTYLTWGLIGGGGTFAALGGVFGGLAASAHGGLYTNNEFVQTQAQSAIDSGKTKALLADVFLSVGVAAAITGVALMFFWDPSASADEQMKSSGPTFGGLDIAPTDGGAMVTVGGSF